MKPNTSLKHRTKEPDGVAQVSKPADLSGSGSRERDCRSEAKARPKGPNERERVSQSPISKSAGRPML
ncbi:MAG TPA: hypothetical protein VMF08_15445 [Candidatus Sulfotelmatobacter sp.]|nr:hypothetical protein [Candidatus Sulfotelmatobacter sp.]